ncbi:glycosyl hydrolase family 32-like protein, partial [Leptotrombidium deliense]
ERFRPQIHFSAPNYWMNDPNGLVYYNGVYHLFYQCNPHGIDFGVMYWCHAASQDLVHWCNLPVALHPNSLGMIFSGSAVVDVNNVTGLQKPEQKCDNLIALYTQNLVLNNKDATLNPLQQQSLAYSADNGVSWKTYKYNPILKNPGIQNFRDPKVITYNGAYIMLIAAGDRIIFYYSHNLTHWTFLSTFGEDSGAHGGVWECPDMFQLKLNDMSYWILIVNINPGAPNSGSGTQYFVGQFDGQHFINSNTKETILWLDYGPDNYAGDSWFGVAGNPVFIGWMSNWLYAANLTTFPWRGQMTFVRRLSLKSASGKIYVASKPHENIKLIYSDKQINLRASQQCKVLQKLQGSYAYDVKFRFNLQAHKQINFCLRNAFNEKLCIIYVKQSNLIVLDRSKARFNQSEVFTSTAKAKRISKSDLMNWRIIIDVSSVELFVDDGLTTMTALYFTKKPLDIMTVNSDATFCVKPYLVSTANIQPLNSIWQKDSCQLCDQKLLTHKKCNKVE